MLITDTVGCKPFRVGVWNLADSFDMRSPSDTPTLSTSFYWGDGQSDGTFILIGRRDTVWHTYTNAGTFHIIALSKDALPLDLPACPIVMTPDTINGFQRPVTVIVNNPYYAKITGPDTVCVGQPFDVINLSDSSSYSKYRYERRKDDSALTFIGKDTGLFLLNRYQLTLTTHFSTVGKYKIIPVPNRLSDQNSVAYARCALQDTITVTALQPFANFKIDTTGFPLYKFTKIHLLRLIIINGHL